MKGEEFDLAALQARAREEFGEPLSAAEFRAAVQDLKSDENWPSDIVEFWKPPLLEIANIAEAITKESNDLGNAIAKDHDRLGPLVGFAAQRVWLLDFVFLPGMLKVARSPTIPDLFWQIQRALQVALRISPLEHLVKGKTLAAKGSKLRAKRSEHYWKRFEPTMRAVFAEFPGRDRRFLTAETCRRVSVRKHQRPKVSKRFAEWIEESSAATRVERKT